VLEPLLGGRYAWAASESKSKSKSKQSASDATERNCGQKGSQCGNTAQLQAHADSESSFGNLCAV
jgi:hypothetical protein